MTPTLNREFLWKLLETPSPTGFEMPGQQVWADEIKPFVDQVDCDAYGSAWGILKGRSEKSIMLEAHADEIGYMIKHIDCHGFLYVDRIGGSDAATARGRRITILGDSGPVAGVIGNVAIHLRKGEKDDDKSPAVHDLWVDIGAASAEEVAELGVRVGHPAVYMDQPTDLANRRIVARALDNRLGSYIIAEVLKQLHQESATSLEYSVLALNAVQEEIGGHGAMMASYRLRPSLCICLDVTHATDTPNMNHAKHGHVKLGEGPTLTHGTSNHPLMVTRLIDIATQRKIPIQHEASSRLTGTDTDKIFHSRRGIPSALVSLPLRSMHSVVETAHLDDVARTIELLTAFVRSLSADDSFEHQISRNTDERH